MSICLYNKLENLGFAQRHLWKYQDDQHPEILSSLKSLVDAAKITTSWGTLKVTVSGYEGSADFEQLISNCLSINRCVDAPPDFLYKCYRLLRKVKKIERPREVDNTTAQLFDSCWPHIKKMIGWNALPREDLLTLYSRSPEKAKSGEETSPLFKFTPEKFQHFFPGQSPLHQYTRNLFGGVFGEQYIETEVICIASKEQMKGYNSNKNQ